MWRSLLTVYGGILVRFEHNGTKRNELRNNWVNWVTKRIYTVSAASRCNQQRLSSVCTLYKEVQNNTVNTSAFCNRRYKHISLTFAAAFLFLMMMMQIMMMMMMMMMIIFSALYGHNFRGALLATGIRVNERVGKPPLTFDHFRGHFVVKVKEDRYQTIQYSLLFFFK